MSQIEDAIAPPLEDLCFVVEPFDPAAVLPLNEVIGDLLQVARQGLQKPVFDLSRGCSVTDIVNVVAINAVMAS